MPPTALKILFCQTFGHCCCQGNKIPNSAFAMLMKLDTLYLGFTSEFVVDTRWKRLVDAILRSTHNIDFHGKK